MLNFGSSHNAQQQQPKGLMGGFGSLSPEQQAHLLKWAALLPPSAASVVPCVPCGANENSEYIDRENNQDGESIMSLSPPETPKQGNEGVLMERDGNAAGNAGANAGWLLQTLFTKSSPQNKLQAMRIIPELVAGSRKEKRD